MKIGHSKPSARLTLSRRSSAAQRVAQRAPSFASTPSFIRFKSQAHRAKHNHNQTEHRYNQGPKKSGSPLFTTQTPKPLLEAFSFTLKSNSSPFSSSRFPFSITEFCLRQTVRSFADEPSAATKDTKNIAENAHNQSQRRGRPSKRPNQGNKVNQPPSGGTPKQPLQQQGQSPRQQELQQQQAQSATLSTQEQQTQPGERKPTANQNIKQHKRRPSKPKTEFTKASESDNSEENTPTIKSKEHQNKRNQHQRQRSNQVEQQKQNQVQQNGATADDFVVNTNNTEPSSIGDILTKSINKPANELTNRKYSKHTQNNNKQKKNGLVDINANTLQGESSDKVVAAPKKLPVKGPRQEQPYWVRSQTNAGPPKPVQTDLQIQMNKQMRQLFESGKLKQAEDIFWGRSSSSLTKPSEVTYNLYLKEMVKRQNWEEIGKVWEKMKKSDVTPSSFTYDLLLDGYLTSKKLDEGLKILDEMIQGGIKSEITYNIIIKGLMKSNRTEGAWKILNEMKDQGVPFDEYTYSGFISPLLKAKRVEEAMKADQFFRESGFRMNAVTTSVMIDGLLKNNKITEAKTIWDGLPEGQKTRNICNVFMHGLFEHGQVDEALKVLQFMTKRGIILDTVSYTNLITGLIENDRVEEAIKLIQGVKLSAENQNTIFNCFLSRIAKAKPELIPSVWSTKIPSDIAITLPTYNTILIALGNHHITNGIVEVVERLINQGLHLNSETYNNIISAYSRNGNITEARTVADSMRFRSVPWTFHTYQHLIEGYKSTGNMEEATSLWQQAKQKGFTLKDPRLSAADPTQLPASSTPQSSASPSTLSWQSQEPSSTSSQSPASSTPPQSASQDASSAQ